MLPGSCQWLKFMLHKLIAAGVPIVEEVRSVSGCHKPHFLFD